MLSFQEAEAELDQAALLNPGPWIAHSRNVAKVARIITAATGRHDPERAATLGLLHDIGRRGGVSHIRHVLDGYDYLIGRDPRAAAICLSHSFPNQVLEEYQGHHDLEAAHLDRLRQLLAGCHYDYYDELIQLADGYGFVPGFVRLEKRWVDSVIRLGFNDHIVAKWKRLYAIRDGMNQTFGIDIEALLGL